MSGCFQSGTSDPMIVCKLEVLNFRLFSKRY